MFRESSGFGFVQFGFRGDWGRVLGLAGVLGRFGILGDLGFFGGGFYQGAGFGGWL